MRTLSMWIIALALVGTTACGKSKSSVCGTAADCADSEICSEGVCQEPSENTCSGDPDCPGGYVCLGNMCQRIDDIDMGGSNSNMPDLSTPNSSVPDMNFDNIPPEVVSVSPADQAVDVAPESQVSIVFNEAMRTTSINIQSIEIRDPANGVVPAMITYDDATFTATLVPQAPLRQATPYRIVATTFVRDANDNPIAGEFEAKFYTAYNEPTGIRAVAEKWAPHIYQALGETSGGSVNVDLPTAVNFDNNLKARDNKSKARLSSTRNTASVYYNVVESKTHYFINYTMYYPIRATGQEDFEHDFTGASLVVDKASDTLVLVDGVKVQNGADTNLGFKPSTSAVNGVGQPQQLEDFDPASLEDTTHYPMFVPPGEHEACAFPVRGRVPYCLHEAGVFPGEGVLLKPGATGQMYSAAVDATNPAYPNGGRTYKEMTYALLPLPSTLWVRRTDVGSELLWQATSVYDPTGDGRPATTTGGSPIVIPNGLVSDDATTFGKPPFQWLRTSTQTNSGQWLFDPAYLMLNKYDFGQTWSQEYCFNVFLDVNLRGDAANPECETDS